MIAIINKEIRSFFNNNIGLIISSIFLIILGLIQWTQLFNLSIFESGYANMHTFFFIAPPLFMIYISAISMKSFSEEFKSGTIEILITKPISLKSIILAKYLAINIIIFITIISTLIYPFTIYFLGENIGNIDLGGIIGSYLGLILTCCSFSSISLYCSSLTKNQVNALLLSILLNIFVFYGFSILSSFINISSLSIIVQKIGSQYHYDLISKGVIIFSDLIYFFSISFLFLFLINLRLQKK